MNLTPTIRRISNSEFTSAHCTDYTNTFTNGLPRENLEERSVGMIHPTLACLGA